MGLVLHCAFKDVLVQILRLLNRKSTIKSFWIPFKAIASHHEREFCYPGDLSHVKSFPMIYDMPMLLKGHFS